MLPVTLPPLSVVRLLDRACGEPRTRWSVESDHGFRRVGRLTHCPLGTASTWTARQRVYVGDAEVGQPILLGHVRSMREISEQTGR